MHKKSLKALFSCFKALSFIYVFQAVHCVCCLTKIYSAVSVVAFFVYEYNPENARQFNCRDESG